MEEFFLDVVLGNSYYITDPEIYINDMFDMFEELVLVKYALRGHVSIYLSVIGSSVDSELLKDALFFKLFSGCIPSFGQNLYSGLLSVVNCLQNYNIESEELQQIICEEAYSKDVCPIWRPEKIRKQCEEIVADCKRDLKVEQVASKSAANSLVQTAEEGFPRANNIQYSCFSNGTLLLAPYRKTGAIMGFVRHTDPPPRLNDIIKAIATFNDDQVDSLPKEFVLMKD